MGVFETNAERLRELHDRVHKLAAERNASSEAKQQWQEAAREFHSRYDELAFPGGLAKLLSDLRNKDTNAVEMAIRFLEADLRFFRSGYIKEGVIQLFVKVELSEQQRERLRNVVIAKINAQRTREFRRYCRLAAHLFSLEFRAKVEELKVDGDSQRKQKKWVLQYLAQAEKENRKPSKSAD